MHPSLVGEGQASPPVDAANKKGWGWALGEFGKDATPLQRAEKRVAALVCSEPGG